MTVKVSTITPCFKGEKYLKGFLNNVAQQTCLENLEVVLDHNEPTENELKIVEEFRKQYPNVLKHIIVNPVEPIGISMNRCIQEASGEYVAIWNIDDLRTSDSLQKQIDFLESNPEYGVVHGNFTIVNQFENVLGQFIDHAWTLDKSEELTRGMMLGPFFMWRKNLCDKVGYFDEQLKTGADFDLAIRLAAYSKVGIIQDNIGYYLDEGKGASTNGNGMQQIERTLIELRYNILDKIEEQYIVPALTRYDKNHVVNFAKKVLFTELISKDTLARNDHRK